MTARDRKALRLQRIYWGRRINALHRDILQNKEMLRTLLRNQADELARKQELYSKESMDPYYMALS